MGPFPTKAVGGYLYAMAILDDCTWWNWVSLLCNKSQAFDSLQHFFSMMKNKGPKFPIVHFKSNCGGDFSSTAFMNYLLSQGFVAERGPDSSPEKNLFMERMNKTLMECTHSQMISASIPNYLWGEVLLATSYIINLCPSKSLQYSCWELALQSLALANPNYKVPTHCLCIIGCAAYTILPRHHHKLSPYSTQMVHIG